MTTVTRVTRKTAPAAVAALEDFDYNRSATGRWSTYMPTDYGVLSRDAADTLRDHAKGNGETFFIYSYDTPIAAYNERLGWWIWDRKYSPTTTTHQTFIRQGMGKRGETPSILIRDT